MRLRLLLVALLAGAWRVGANAWAGNKCTQAWSTGGDSLRFGHDSLWLTDYKKGLVWRFQSVP
jgi:hypothetical protein